MEGMLMAKGMVHPFNDKLEGHLLYEEWREWKGQFERTCLAVKVVKQDDKFNWLMALGDRFIAKIYENSPKADDESEFRVASINPDDSDEEPKYDNAIKRISKYFDSKSNPILQKEILREMKQTSEEDFTSFLIRLRQQVRLCGYADNAQEEEIRFQITQGAKSDKVRQKARQEKNLDDLTTFATGQEADEAKLKKAATSNETASVNAMKMFRSRPKSEKKNCFRCNATDHMSFSSSCPGHDTTCEKCGRKGHFTICCRSSYKRPHDGKKMKKEPFYKKPKIVSNIMNDEDDEDEVK